MSARYRKVNGGLRISKRVNCGMSVIAVLSWAAALVCIVAILPASSPAAVIGYYRFEEGSGASFLDSSGYGLAGTVNGASFSTDVPLSGVPQTGDPNRFSFNLGSVGNYGLVPYSASLNPTAEITVETWVKLDADLPSFASGFVGRQYGNDNRNSFNLGVRNGNGSIFFEITNAGGVDASAEIFSGLALNQWYHLAGVYDGSEIRLYVDGALAGSSSFSGAIGYAVNRPVLIGGDNEGYSFSPSFFLHGKLDEVRISDTALPPQQFLLSVPEPTTSAMALTGLAGGLAMWRRRRC